MGNHRLLLGALVLFTASLGLGIARLIPVPAVSFTWKQPRTGDHKPYTPAFRIDENRELVLVYIGSRFCDASNHAALPGLVEELKHEMLLRAVDLNIGFSVVGVGIDWLPTDGWKHLGKYGAFDEIIVGRKWSGLGARQFMKEVVVGTSATPQILVYERRKRGEDGVDTTAWDNVVLARKLGINRIQNWADRGAPTPNLP